jgi:hypothetical protein
MFVAWNPHVIVLHSMFNPIIMEEQMYVMHIGPSGGGACLTHSTWPMAEKWEKCVLSFEWELV